MVKHIRTQRWPHFFFYVLFGLLSFILMMYYLSNTLFYFTTPHQFPIDSFKRFPLTFLIFPAEVFSVLFGLYFVYNLLSDSYRPSKPTPLKDKEKVAILLPVKNEPPEILERTIKACLKVRWQPGTIIYILDDFIADPAVREKNMKAMDDLASRYGCVLVRRNNNHGYKAGNINHAIKNVVKEPYFMILDSDQAPYPEFLEESMDYFSDPKVGFVQTPQHFVNDSSPIGRAAKIGTNIFYHAQCLSKARDGAMPFCGTNAILKTEVFRKVNGFSYYTATEDIELGLRINEAGYKGAYVAKILVDGYAPEDFKAYSSQQYRWANGNLAILRQSWPAILGGKFNFRQQVHILFTLAWWLIGVTTLAYILVPLLSMTFGLGTHHTWLPSYLLGVLFFNVLLGISMIYISLQGRIDGEKIRFSDALLQYSLITNSMFIYTRAAFNALVLKRYIGFVTTNKRKTVSGIGLIKWNLLLGIVCFGFSIYSLYNSIIASSLEQMRTYLPLSLWLLFYSLVLISSIIFIDVGRKS